MDIPRNLPATVIAIFVNEIRMVDISEGLKDTVKKLQGDLQNVLTLVLFKLKPPPVLQVLQLRWGQNYMRQRHSLAASTSTIPQTFKIRALPYLHGCSARVMLCANLVQVTTHTGAATSGFRFRPSVAEYQILGRHAG